MIKLEIDVHKRNANNIRFKKNQNNFSKSSF